MAQHRGVQAIAESRRLRVLQPLGHALGRQILGHVLVVLVVGVAEFLVGVVGNFQVGIVEVIEEEAQPFADRLVLVFQGAEQILGHVAVLDDGHAAIGIDLAAENVAVNEVAILVAFSANGGK